MLRKSNRQSGHTLFELLIVLALLTAAAGLAAPSIGASRSAIEARALARAIEGELKLTRSRAILRAQTMLVEIDSAGRRWRADEGAEWTPIANGLSLAFVGPSALSGDVSAISYYPDGASSGGEIVVASKTRTFRVRAALNGGTTIERENS